MIKGSGTVGDTKPVIISYITSTHRISLLLILNLELCPRSCYDILLMLVI